MHRLLCGIRRFHHQVFPTCATRFNELAAGQQPSTLFITCSDSRIVPHLVTQSEPGDLFVLRNAGNLVPPFGSDPSGEAATIEYAVKVLNVQDIVVCGHSHCGAITGVLRPEQLRDLPAVKKWLTHAGRVREQLNEGQLANDGDDDLLAAAIKVNVLAQLEHLRTYPAVAEAESKGDLSLHGFFYRFETGEVTAFDTASGGFVSLTRDGAQESTVA